MVQSDQRVPEGTRWDKTLLLSIRSTPWEPSASDASATDLPELITIKPEMPQVEARDPQVVNRESGPRRVYITRRTLDKFGYTPGYSACDETRLGFRGPGVLHTDACRANVEAGMKTDPAEASRLERADERINERLAQAIAGNIAGDVNASGSRSDRFLQVLPQSSTSASSSEGRLRQPPPTRSGGRPDWPPGIARFSTSAEEWPALAPS